MSVPKMAVAGLAVLLSIVLLVGSCMWIRTAPAEGDPMADDPPPSTSAEDGWLIVSGPERAELRYRAGTFPDHIQPQLEAVDHTDSFVKTFGLNTGSSGLPLVIDVDSEAQPNTSVELSLPYDRDLVSEGVVPALFYLEEELELWLPIKTEVDEQAGVLIGTADHFTFFTTGSLSNPVDQVSGWEGLDVLKDGIDWLTFQLADFIGARADAPDCGTDDANRAQRPPWAGQLEMDHGGMERNSIFLTCLASVGDDAELRLSLNRAYSMEFSMSSAPTSVDIDTPYSLHGAAGRAALNQWEESSGDVVVLPAGFEMSVVFAQPTEADEIRIEARITTQTLLLDAVILATESIASSSGAVEALDCAMGAIEEGMAVESSANLTDAWLGIASRCLEPLARKTVPDAAAHRLMLGIQVGLALGTAGQTVWDAGRDLSDGSAWLRIPVIDVAGSVPESRPAPTGVGPMTGHWAGPVTGAQSGYDVDVVISDSSESVSGWVHYPQLSCGGTWIETGRTDAQVELHEEISYGSRCAPSVDVELISAGHDELHFTAHWKGRTITSVLTRVH